MRSYIHGCPALSHAYTLFNINWQLNGIRATHFIPSLSFGTMYSGKQDKCYGAIIAHQRRKTDFEKSIEITYSMVVTPTVILHPYRNVKALVGPMLEAKLSHCDATSQLSRHILFCDAVRITQK